MSMRNGFSRCDIVEVLSVFLLDRFDALPDGVELRIAGGERSGGNVFGEESSGIGSGGLLRRLGGNWGLGENWGEERKGNEGGRKQERETRKTPVP
jgi:hypothetical protein